MQLISESSVLKSAEFIYNNANNIWINSDKVDSVAEAIIRVSKNGKIPSWTDHILNPTEKMRKL
jgi:nitrogen regulatory protein PII